MSRLLVKVQTLHESQCIITTLLIGGNSGEVDTFKVQKEWKLRKRLMFINPKHKFARHVMQVASRNVFLFSPQSTRKHIIYINCIKEGCVSNDFRLQNINEKSIFN